MAILYRRLKRIITKNGEKEEKYIAKCVLQSTVSFQDVAEYISHNSTMTEGEVYLALQQLEDCLEAFILNGTKVKLGRLGTFAPQIEAMAMDSPEKVTHRSIKRAKIVFRPSAHIKEKLKEAEFHLLDKGAVFEPMYKMKKKPFQEDKN